MMSGNRAVLRSEPFRFLFVSLFLLLPFLLASSPAEAGRPRRPAKPYSVGNGPRLQVFEGIVTGVTGTVVSVRNRTYDVRSAEIKTPAGEARRVDALPGKKVEIFVREGKIRTVLVHDSMIE